jgi:hypothetical protein
MAKNIGRQNQILAANEVSQCAPKEPNFFHFGKRGGGRGWVFWILVVPDVFPSNSHCVPMKFSIPSKHLKKIPNVFPNMFPIAPHFISYTLHYILFF